MKKMPTCSCRNCEDYRSGCYEKGMTPDDCGCFKWSQKAIAKMPDKKVFVLMANPRFEKPILEGRKIHTIRKNYAFWEKRIATVNRGEAVLSLRVWSGKPYRSPQREFLRLEKAGIEKITKINTSIFDNAVFLFRTEKHLIPNYELARNDGLTEEEFTEWFEDYPDGEMAIVHFTDFRYEGGQK